MKLVLKRVPGRGKEAPFALHTEDGECLPAQVKTSLISAPDSATVLVVEFHVFRDGPITIVDQN